jgi:hypothetical protein
MHLFRSGVHRVVAALVGAVVGAVPSAWGAAAATTTLRDRCAGCHTAGGTEGGLDLDALLAAFERGRPAAGSAEHRAWEAVVRNVRFGTMPPADEPRPSAEERATLVRFVQQSVFGLDPALPDPGRVVLRRLNRDEYARTVRDLVGLSVNLADVFPPDDTGYGFDTIGAVLSVSPLLVEKYLETAREIANRVLAPARAAEADEAGTPAYPPATKAVFHEGPPPADPAAHPAALRRLLGRLASRAFRRPVDEPTLDALTRLAGTAAGIETTGDRAAARRRFEDAVEIGIVTLLAAPRFIYRIEAADPAAPHAPAGGGLPIDEFSLAGRLSYFLWGTMPDGPLLDLAAAGTLRARLDETVDAMIDDPRSAAFVSAFTGQWLQIRDVETIAFDASRILGITDRGAAEKVFSGAVRRAMREETEMLFAHVLRERLPVTDLLVAPYTFLNRPLARFYGLESLVGEDGDGLALRLVELPADSHRGGLLTHGSVLAVTSNPTRTSPVKRGLFILENLLGAPPPPAPPDVPTLEQAAAVTGSDATMRDLLEVHRRDPLCSSCHARMDPLGLALESYDALGRWRDAEGGRPIHTAGRLVTGETFVTVEELARRLAEERRSDVHRCLAEKMLTFAIGRGMEYFDAPTVDTIVERLAADGSLRALVHEVVRSAAFQRMRQPDEEVEP